MLKCRKKPKRTENNKRDRLVEAEGRGLEHGMVRDRAEEGRVKRREAGGRCGKVRRVAWAGCLVTVRPAATREGSLARRRLGALGLFGTRWFRRGRPGGRVANSRREDGRGEHPRGDRALRRRRAAALSGTAESMVERVCSFAIAQHGGCGTGSSSPGRFTFDLAELGSLRRQNLRDGRRHVATRRTRAEGAYRDPSPAGQV